MAPSVLYHIHCAIFQIWANEISLWWRLLQSQALAWWKPLDWMMKTIVHDDWDHLIRIWLYPLTNDSYVHIGKTLMTTHAFMFVTCHTQTSFAVKWKLYNCVFAIVALCPQKNWNIIHDVTTGLVRNPSNKITYHPEDAWYVYLLQKYP